MAIGKRVKILREQKNMCQGDIQKRTGLLRCYISRVENGHTVPSVDTLERLAGSSAANPDVPAFTDAEQEKKPNLPAEAIASRAANSKTGTRDSSVRQMLSTHG